MSVSDRIISQWEKEIGVLINECDRLRLEGIWTSGPCDVLSIIRQSRRENCHSDMIAWILDPGSPHGMGAAFLQNFLRRSLPEVQFSEEEFRGAYVAREVVQEVTRADIVIRFPKGKRPKRRNVVIEVKIDASEGIDQCARIIRDFQKEDEKFNTETFYVFLTLNGDTPKSVRKQNIDEFHLLRFSDIRELIGLALHENPASREQVSAGHRSALSYLDTLNNLLLSSKDNRSNVIDDTGVLFYLKHREIIDKWTLPSLALKKKPNSLEQKFYQEHRVYLDLWSSISKRALSIATDFYHTLSPEFEALASSLDGKIETMIDVDYKSLKQYLLKRHSWPDGVGIGFVWGGKQTSDFWPDCCGVWVDEENTFGRRAREEIGKMADSSKGEQSGDWWAIYSFGPKPVADNWRDLDAYRQTIIQSVAEAWNKYSSFVDDFVKAKN